MKKYANLFQIGEVVALFDISRKMLLNYENHGLIKPAIIDENTGYRYFDSYTIARVQLILDLRKTGMSISDIDKYLKGKLSAAKQICLLREQILASQKAIEQLEIRNTEYSAEPIIKEITLPKRYCICTDYTAQNVDDAIDTVISCYYNCLKRGLKFADGSYHFCEFSKDLFDKDFYELTNITMKVCISVDKKCAPADAVVYPETKAVSVSFCGEYNKSIASYELIKKYIIKHGYTVTGFPQEIYLEGNFDNNSDKNIIWIVVPVK
ncbi:MAG: MerR family transcriptional regulator [Clostridia bacterium]|nr:MerR family transcriptional regulator [Clostridia bacterium]